jgi:hypothetical protein
MAGVCNGVQDEVSRRYLVMYSSYRASAASRMCFGAAKPPVIDDGIGSRVLIGGRR